jgi:LPS O-antigen subunit length determinant protein (WzzB/FepE family)
MIHERRRLQHGLKVLEGTLADLAIQERDAISKVEQHRERLESEIAQHRSRAQPVDDSEVEGLESALVTARQARDQANELVISAEQALERAKLDLLTAESGPRPTPEHRRLVVEADASDGRSCTWS